jgi:hypothetical protein
MTMRDNVLLGLAVLHAGTLIGCSPAPQSPSATATTDEPTLTAAAAKQALLARMKSDRLFGFNPDR